LNPPNHPVGRPLNKKEYEWVGKTRRLVTAVQIENAQDEERICKEKSVSELKEFE